MFHGRHYRSPVALLAKNKTLLGKADAYKCPKIEQCAEDV